MTSRTRFAVAAALVVSAFSAQAALVNRGGGLIYDTELNITWLQDWNYAKTSGHSGAGVNPNGRMTYGAATQWAADLVYGGYSDWRLPTMVDTGAPGCDLSYAGGTDCGTNVQTKTGNTVYSEMAHLYYETLGNLSYCDPAASTANSCVEQPGWGLKNTGPFTNLLSAYYWFGLESAFYAN